MRGFLILWHNRSYWLLPAGIVLMVLIVNMLLLPVYGVTWDEPLHFNWGKLFVVFWQTGDRRILELMPGHGIYYGPLTYALNFLLSGYFVEHWGWSLVLANHFLTACLFSLSIPLMFLLGNEMFGRRIGLLATLLFVLYPPLIAHGQYNPKDIPLLVAFTLAMLMVVRAVRRPTIFRVAIAGLCFGFAVTAKVTALILLPIVAMSVLLTSVIQWRGGGWSHAFSSSCNYLHQQWRRIVLRVAVFCIVGFIGIFLFWPSLWGDPLLLWRSLKFFSTGTFWSGHVLYFGREYAGAALPWHYMPFQILLSTPLPTLIIFVMGCEVVMKQSFSFSAASASSQLRQNFIVILLLTWFFLPLLYSLKPGLVRYDGLRQFFIIVPALCIIASIGLDWLMQKIAKKIHRSHTQMLAVASAILFVWIGLEIAYVHPYEGSYVSMAARPFLSKPFDRQIELEYWGASYKEGVEWLHANAEPNSVICVPIAGAMLAWYDWRQDIEADCTQGKANYVMFFTRYSEAKQYAFTENLKPVFTISRYGSDLLKIYKVR